jgi:hypothetical protein
LTKRFFLLAVLILFAGAGWADDGAYLQNLLDQGGQITLDMGRVYSVSDTLYLGSNTSLDLNGATLMLAPNSYCSLIKEKTVGIENVEIINGTIIGNGSQQPEFNPGIGIAPTFYLVDVNCLTLTDLDMYDVWMYGIYAKGNNGVLNRIFIDGAVGGGIHVDGMYWEMDEIDVRNVTYWEDINCQGNPFTVSLVSSHIGSLFCKNFGFGVKIQDGSENVVIDSLTAIAGPNNFEHPDPLVKIQGKKPDRPNTWITVKKIVARGGPQAGLYVYFSEWVKVNSFTFKNNNQITNPDDKYNYNVVILESPKVSLMR